MNRLKIPLHLQLSQLFQLLQRSRMSLLTFIFFVGTICSGLLYDLKAQGNDQGSQGNNKGNKLVKALYSKSEPVSILFLGDSLTQGYLVSEENNYPTQVGKLFDEAGYNVKVVNAGLNGDTTAGGLNRYQWFIKTDFDILFIALGSNDGLRGLDLGTVEKNLLEIIEKTKAKSKASKKKINIILSGLKIPPNYGKEYTKKFELIFPRLAKKEKVIFYPFLLEGVAGEIELNQNDGIHPNEKGYKLIAKNLVSFLEKNFFKK